MLKYQKFLIPFFFLFYILLLCACGKQVSPEVIAEPTTVTMPDGSEIEKTVESLDLGIYTDSDVQDLLPLIGKFTNLSAINLGDESNLSADGFVSIASSYPNLDYSYSFDFNRKNTDIKSESLDIEGVADTSKLIKLLPYMKMLSNVHVGSEEESPISWNSFAEIVSANSNPVYDYSFTLYGESLNTSDTEIDLRKIPVDDSFAALRQVLPCMNKCTYTDIDGCIGHSDAEYELMAKLRDDFPDRGIVWRVFFSYNYSCRTDVETILCSAMDPYGDWGLKDDESSKPLTYCTKVKYLDVGHNNKMESIKFTSYMPDLEVLIIYHSNVKDLSPLANCKHLRYFEVGLCPIKDLSPLAECTELTDLQMGNCIYLEDITPLYGLNLERLWLGNATKVPQKQIDEFRKLHPDCEVNTTDNEVDSTWRYKEVNQPIAPNVYWPQYKEIREIFNYGENGQGQNFSGYDPYYNNSHDNPPDPEKSARYR